MGGMWGETRERNDKGKEKSFGGDRSFQYLDFGHDFMDVMSVKTWYIYRHPVYVKTANLYNYYVQLFYVSYVSIIR